ncbi:MAG: molybdopterin cofactor-binding domain-containing protein [Saprospiraceae bacterium]|jgi:xanthine dehydrogenase large subunit|uniref:xanthine dehydrogenase molybdopterin binding subunit n=1 Tax=Candidatus Brachybacter algidus TaxID=2982024 RepID=UPI001B51F11A|nr:molybdopterin cofactor-binding domain-containing protein [Candidatus Brachybacter algidus]MBP7307433.1 molybdopterin-dependent oxidoreductase [Saprospiraceae bacterium]MBK6449402.1 molybdopterin-dependent oxidoreductase [Candidatus Brachybacter algidus]MBK9398541.1 molybdopterin-dependent oxidoreductase [Candidatus Brachybacter algidus]MBL0117641.1 molybdopterin-dependent oxidoreductase [Candidatus Brachybacter algidus]MBP7541261.1 molybdopterin-dependent oxidoreductase [Saprospiraceae bact
MRSIDIHDHVKGRSIYLDDIPLIQGTLFARVFTSNVAHGRIIKLDISKARDLEGVHKVLISSDITGINQIGGIIDDEPLMAENIVDFIGMPIALVLADSESIARKACKLIDCKIEAFEEITDPRIAYEKGALIIPSKKFILGDTESTWSSCSHIFEGKADINGQEHLYIETQGAYAQPVEGGKIKVYSSTQGPTAVQRAVAKVTGMEMHSIEVDVTRIGGGFGGKEDQANAWAALCALGTHITGRPVKYSLSREEDIYMTGKRHPYSADFKIGFDNKLKILAYEVTFFQNAGAAADLSPAVLERTLFHCTNAYFIPNVIAIAHCCKTNLPPNTAFRGFGGPQGMFVIECAIAIAAPKLNCKASDIQKANLITTGDVFPYGQLAESEAETSWQQFEDRFDLKKMQQDVDQFNKENIHLKKGLAVQPICFGISFTKTLMNQARSLVHIYTDGSVGITTGAVEMGQGVNTKIAQVAAHIFSLPIDKIRIYSTNTTRIANTSPSAASATADLNGKATLMACEAIKERLKKVVISIADTKEQNSDIEIRDGLVFLDSLETKITWQELISKAFEQRVSLSEHAHYATPDVHFDWSKGKGHPFSYHVYGTSVTQVTVDCIRGNYEIDFVKVVHDYGQSMNPMIDLGQIEGGIVQGIGWMTCEDVFYDEKGKLRSNALSTYKIPDIYAAPKEIDIIPLITDKENLAILQSKAVGEPPLMYGLGTYFAIENAIQSFNPTVPRRMNAPYTPEKVLLALYGSKDL